MHYTMTELMTLNGVFGTWMSERMTKQRPLPQVKHPKVSKFTLNIS